MLAGMAEVRDSVGFPSLLLRAVCSMNCGWTDDNREQGAAAVDAILGLLQVNMQTRSPYLGRVDRQSPMVPVVLAVFELALLPAGKASFAFELLLKRAQQYRAPWFHQRHAVPSKKDSPKEIPFQWPSIDAEREAAEQHGLDAKQARASLDAASWVTAAAVRTSGCTPRHL